MCVVGGWPGVCGGWVAMGLWWVWQGVWYRFLDITTTYHIGIVEYLCGIAWQVWSII